MINPSAPHPIPVVNQVVTGMKKNGDFDRFRKGCLDYAAGLPEYEQLQTAIMDLVKDELSLDHSAEKVDELRTQVLNNVTVQDKIGRLLSQCLSMERVGTDLYPRVLACTHQLMNLPPPSNSVARVVEEECRSEDTPTLDESNTEEQVQVDEGADMQVAADDQQSVEMDMSESDDDQQLFEGADIDNVKQEPRSPEVSTDGLTVEPAPETQEVPAVRVKEEIIEEESDPADETLDEQNTDEKPESMDDTHDCTNESPEEQSAERAQPLAAEPDTVAMDQSRSSTPDHIENDMDNKASSIDSASECSEGPAECAEMAVPDDPDSNDSNTNELSTKEAIVVMLQHAHSPSPMSNVEDTVSDNSQDADTAEDSASTTSSRQSRRSRRPAKTNKMKDFMY